MDNFDGCQLPCLVNISEGKAEFEPQPLFRRFKRFVARPWNYHVKRWLKRAHTEIMVLPNKMIPKDAKSMSEDQLSMNHLEAGDWVWVRPLDEIQNTLSPFKDLKGCAFLEGMKQYCGTKQRVFKVMERFLDERDYQVKKARGIVLLDGVYCQGTPVFGRCDRSCLSFWREEWLQKIEQPISE